MRKTRKSLSILIAALMVLTLLPVTALAADIEMEAVDSGNLVLYDTTIGFGGYEWVVIGNNGSDIASSIGTLTLFARA